MSKHDNSENFKIAEKWAVIGIIGNIILSVLKFAAGVLGNSSAMVADAIHSASDIVASFFVYIGIKISKKPADEKHPYGHYKAEVVTTLIVGVMLWMAGIEIIKTAVNTIQSGNIETPGLIALIAAVASILSKELMYRLTYRAGKKINSPSTIANAMDHRSDAYSSVATLIGIGAARMGFPIMDPIAGIVVSLFIFKMGYEIVVEAVKQIMDESVGEEKIKEVEEIANSVDGVIDSHFVRIRQSGSIYMIDMDIVVDDKITIKSAHDICENVRKILYEKMENVGEIRIHIDPKLYKGRYELMKGDAILDKITLEFLRNQVIGKDSFFNTPYGEKVTTYADYTASGKPLKFIENYLLDIEKYYANSHTEDDVTGESMTNLLHKAELIIKKEFNGEDNCSVIAAGTGATGALIAFSKIIGLYMAPATKKLLMNILVNPDEKKVINKIFEKEHHENAPVVFIGPYEHHSNILVWRESLAELVEIKLNDEGYLDLKDLESQVSNPKYANRLKIGSFSAGSNVTGIKTPVYDVARILHKYDALACFDFAASGPYVEIDMNKDKDSYFDAIYLSPHKFIGGPGSSGILMINNRVYDLGLAPTVVGGGTVDYVSGFGHDYVNNIEEREKAGTPGIIQIIKAALAIQLKGIIGTKTIESIEEDYTKQFIKRFENNNDIEILGPTDPQKRLSIISFMVKHNNRYFHPRYITTLLNDLFGIQSRAGCSCAGPYGHKLLDIDDETSEQFRRIIQKGVNSIKPGWVRINLHYSMAQETVDFLIDAIEFISVNAKYFLKEYQVDILSGGWSHLESIEDGANVVKDFGVYCGFEMKDKNIFDEKEILVGQFYRKYFEQADRIVDSLKKDSNEPVGKYKNENIEKLNWFLFDKAINNT